MPSMPAGTAPLAFQSTHPVRGATHQHADARKLDIISIHAPREGCDWVISLMTGMSIRFQSTHPVRGATETVPRTHDIGHISIHAPREGCDTGVLLGCKKHRDFNPRTP